MKSKILLVDDKIENLIVIEKFLSGFDFEFVRASSGKEALAKSVDNTFVLAVIKSQIADMVGYETIRLVRQVIHNMGLPVIYIIPGPEVMYPEKLDDESGSVDFIFSPVDPRILSGKVKLLMDLYHQKKKLIQEIEHRKQLERILSSRDRELAEAKMNADLADKKKTIFLANISHEIRTPMNSIIGFSNLLKNQDLAPDDQVRYINYLNNSGESLLKLMNDISEYTKLESDQIKIIKETINIHDVVHEIVDSFVTELHNRNKSEVMIITDIDPTWPPVFISTDYYRFKQILSNLLLNAIIFTYKGQIKLGYLVRENDLEFYVSDTGIGIPADKLNTVFDRFEQLENKPENNFIGTGLGLTIAKRLVELLGGKIFVESQPGIGTKFSFTFPYKPKNKIEIPAKDRLEFQSDDFDLKGKTILIAEDEEINFFFLKEALRKTQVEILWAHNGQEAIELFHKYPEIMMVLMDIKMPVMDGYEALAAIKKIRSVSVIAQTAYAMAGEKDLMLQSGFDACLTKPINIQLLLATINKFAVLVS